MGTRAWLATAGLLAVGFLLVMVISGRTRPTPNLVKFEAAGLMHETPDRIDEVDLTAAGRQLVFTRQRAGRWAVAPSAHLPSSVLSHLEMSLKFMHVTAPVRVMTRGEYQEEALREYSLDPPRYTVSLRRGGQMMLAASFGGKNPEGVLQYVRVTGRDELYLLPVFVGREWELVAERVTGS